MPITKPASKAGTFWGFSSGAKGRATGAISILKDIELSNAPLAPSNTGSRLKKSGLMVSTMLAGLSASLVPAQANFLSSFHFQSPFLKMGSNEILMLAVFGGAMSFALLSAFWMIRERSRMVEENRKLRVSLSDLRARNDRNEALVKAPGQRVVVWNGADEEPYVTGDLQIGSSVPKVASEFLAFGSWLDNQSAEALEPDLRNLRLNAQSFDTVVKTKSGELIEAHGNTSGSFAYVRFVDLEGQREEFARLSSEHKDLKSTFANIENLLQRLPMPIWLRNEGGGLSWVNRAYSEAIEAENPQEVVQKNLDLFDPELRARVHSAGENDDLFRDEVPVTVEGDRRKLEIFGVKSDEGSAGLAIDKSDLDLIRRRLDETNEGHAKMLDQIATAVAIFDASKRLVFHNSGFRQLWDLDPGFLESGPGNAELLDTLRDGKLLPEHPDWRKWRDSQLEIYQALEPSEEWWHLLDGQTLRVVVTPRNEGGATWVFENVTERLALESNYNSLIRVQGETLDHLNDAVAVFGSDGKLRLFNPALEELWQRSDLMIAEGVHISRVIEAWTESISNETDLEAILGQVTGFSDTREDLRGRMEMRDGTALEYSVVPLPDGQTMFTLLDITATVKFEKALQERAEALEASDLLKSKFIQHVSYELRAPLTSISGFGELMATPEIGPLNAKQQEYVGHINSSADLLRTLVDDILDLASIDAGTMQLDLVENVFTQVVDEAVAELASPFKKKGLDVEVQVQSKKETVLADKDRLQQILGNLLANAIEFSPDGGTIHVAGRIQEDAYEIRISDEGPGIEPDDRASIFDRFESRAATGSRHGVGLGLSLVRGFIELHGGTICVEDSEKGGACFVCVFPRKEIIDGASDGSSDAASEKAA